MLYYNLWKLEKKVNILVCMCRCCSEFFNFVDSLLIALRIEIHADDRGTETRVFQGQFTTNPMAGACDL